MRKVELRMNEEYKYKIIKKLVETNGNKQRAAVKLKRSVRQIDRMIAGYKEFGKEFFVHGNRGRKPKNALTEEFKTAKKKEQDQLKAKLVLAEDAHPRQPRCQYFGEELQMDACIYPWFGKKKTAKVEEDTFTQYAYACKQLGIHIETSSVPEFKPRVKRLFQTLQQRLPQELRIAQISTIDELTSS